MKKNNLLLLLLSACVGHGLFAQAPGAKIYKPVDCRGITMNGQVTAETQFRKLLVLTDDQCFYFKDYTSGSCWTWFEVKGKWQRMGDSLMLEWKENLTDYDKTVLVTYYTVTPNGLVYVDSNEDNIVRNWGEFFLQKGVKNLATDLKEDYEIAAWVKSHAVYLECLKRFDWTKKLIKNISVESLLSFRRWKDREELIDEKKKENSTWDHLSLDEMEAVLDVYDTLWYSFK